MFRWGAADAEPEAVEVARLHNLAWIRERLTCPMRNQNWLHLRSSSITTSGAVNTREIAEGRSANTVGLDEKTTASSLGYMAPAEETRSAHIVPGSSFR